MSVTSIRLDKNKRKALEIIASLEGKTMGKIVEGWIDDYINENISKLLRVHEKEDIYRLTKLSEDSFAELNYDVDNICSDIERAEKL